MSPGASPNLGSAVTSSMNLTNCDSEHSIMNSAAAYKMDNDSVFYQVCFAIFVFLFSCSLTFSDKNTSTFLDDLIRTVYNQAVISQGKKMFQS